MNKNWYRIKQYFRQYKVKLTVSMFLCSIVPLIAMGVLAYNYSYKIGVDRILQATVRSDDQINIQLNNRINQVESTAITLQYEVYTLLNSQDDLSKSLSAFNNVRNNVSLYNSAFDFFHTYIFLPDYVNGSDEGLTFFSTDELDTLDINVDTIRSLSNTSYWFYQNKIFLPSTLVNDNDSDCVGCIKALNNKSTERTDYVIVICLQPDELSNLLKNTLSDDEISSFIINSDGEIMAHTDQSLLGSFLPQSYVMSITSNGSVFYKDSIHYHVVQLDNGWYHVTEIPQSYINTNIHSLLTAILILNYSSVNS